VRDWAVALLLFSATVAGISGIRRLAGDSTSLLIAGSVACFLLMATLVVAFMRRGSRRARHDDNAL
jgi:hypothetical protein